MDTTIITVIFTLSLLLTSLFIKNKCDLTVKRTREDITHYTTITLMARCSMYYNIILNVLFLGDFISASTIDVYLGAMLFFHIDYVMYFIFKEQ